MIHSVRFIVVLDTNVVYPVCSGLLIMTFTLQNGANTYLMSGEEL